MEVRSESRSAAVCLDVSSKPGSKLEGCESTPPPAVPADVHTAPCQLRLRWAIQSASQPTVQPRSRAKASLEMASRHAVAPFSFRCISANTHNRVPSLPGPHFWPHSAPWRRGVERGNTHRPWSRARGNRGCISAAPSTLFQPPGNHCAGFGAGWKARPSRAWTASRRVADTLRVVIHTR